MYMFRKRSVGVIFAYFMLLTSFFNTVARTSVDADITLYRCFLPLILVAYCLSELYHLRNAIFTLGIFILWNIIPIAFFHADIRLIAQMSFHFLCIFCIYVLVRYIQLNSDHFERDMYRFLDVFTLATILGWIFQYITKLSLSTTMYRGIPVVIYWTENELGMALAMMFPLYCMKCLKHWELSTFLKILAIVAILFIGDNKICVIGCSLAIFLCLFLRRGKIPIRLGAKISIAVFSVLVMITGLFVINPTLTFRDYNIELGQLLLDPIRRIITLEPYRSAGSIQDRTDAVIYGIIELKKTGFLGIGLGNAVLCMDKYHVATAQSMHNFFMQLICELGWPMILYLVYMLGHAIVRASKETASDFDIIRLIYAISFILISMQSSSAIFSNYTVFTILFFIWRADGRLKTLQNKKRLVLRRSHYVGNYES